MTIDEPARRGKEAVGRATDNPDLGTERQGQQAPVFPAPSG